MHSLGLTDLLSQDYLELASNALVKYVERAVKPDRPGAEALSKLLEFVVNAMKLAEDLAKESSRERGWKS